MRITELRHRLTDALLRRLARAGIEVNRFRHGGGERALAWQLIEAARVDVVIDVGANHGQFALGLLAIDPSLRMVSFEPLESAHAALRCAARGYRNWKIADRMALGARSGNASLFVAGNSQSSSLLPMLPLHERAAPESVYVDEQPTPIDRLDQVASGYWGTNDRLLLKMDTQGSERDILDGAGDIIDQVVGIQTEISFAELYQHQPLAFDAIRDIEQRGFSLFGICSDFRDPLTHTLLQANAFFIRADAHHRPRQP